MDSAVSEQGPVHAPFGDTVLILQFASYKAGRISSNYATASFQEKLRFIL
jgi:hypothetical protein